jgi:predicted dehydrogenase
LPSVKIIGAGQLGSRHLQALQSVQQSLDIEVIDPSSDSLAVARERFEAVAGTMHHDIRFNTKITAHGPTDIAIVATSANVRRQVVEQLLAASEVRFMVLEKLLFDRPDDYEIVARAIGETETRAWVNCPMRMMPTYERIHAEFGKGPINYRVTGSQFGLVTNAIHYIDHLAHLSGCPDFSLDTDGLDPTPIPSKRAGFLELTGRLESRHTDGSRCEVVCYADGIAPVIVEIFTSHSRFIVRESEGRVWSTSSERQWRWSEEKAPIPFQSQITVKVVGSLLTTGTCELSPLVESMRIHRALLDPLLAVLQQQRPALDYYPFT